jgi:endonuclease YncB( thermonuclease family)
MRTIAVTLIAALVAVAPASADTPASYTWPVVEVTDGDTIKVTIPGLPPELNPVGVRLLGINTPETGGRAACVREKELGERAKSAARRLVADALKAGRPIVFQGIKWDKYGGRVNATVLIGGKDLAKTLISRGLGMPYDGGKRQSWC